MQFNTILKDLRLEFGLTQTQLAKKANLATSCIAMLETNKREPNANTLIALSSALNVSTDYLLGLDNSFAAPKLGTKITSLTNESSHTSPEENNLLSIYRSLSPDMRDTLWSLLATWAPTETLLPARKKSD